MRLKTDLEFKQKKIFDLYKKYNVETFSTAVRSGKAFAAEQKIRELKKRISRLSALQKNMKVKCSPKNIIEKAVDNMNSLPSAKYGIAPNDIEKKSLSSETYREWFDIRRLGKVSNSQYRYEKKKYQKKKKKLRIALEIGKDVLLLSSRLKKKDLPRVFYKSSTDNKSYFDKKAIFTMIKKQDFDNKTFYWIKDKENKEKDIISSDERRNLRFIRKFYLKNTKK